MPTTSIAVLVRYSASDLASVSGGSVYSVSTSLRSVDGEIGGGGLGPGPAGGCAASVAGASTQVSDSVSAAAARVS